MWCVSIALPHPVLWIFSWQNTKKSKLQKYWHWIDPVSAALYQSQVAIIFFMMKMMIDDNKIKHNKIPSEMDIAPRYTLWHHDIANTAQTACNAFTSGDTPETVTSTRAPAVLITFIAIKGLDEWPHVDLKTLEGGGCVVKMRWEKNGDCCWCVVELIIYFGHNSHIPIHWSHMSPDQNPPFDKETKMRSFSRRHHYDRFKIEGEGISEKNALSFLRHCTHYPFPPSRNLCNFSTWKNVNIDSGSPHSPDHTLCLSILGHHQTIYWKVFRPAEGAPESV